MLGPYAHVRPMRGDHGHGIMHACMHMNKHHLQDHACDMHA